MAEKSSLLWSIFIAVLEVPLADFKAFAMFSLYRAVKVRKNVEYAEARLSLKKEINGAYL